MGELLRGARGPVPEAGPLLPRLSLGHAATSTRGNAREVAAWARGTGIREITVVTAGFHMPRAMLELRRALPEAALRPHPVEPVLARPLPMVREYAKLVGASLGLSALTERPPGGRALAERVLGVPVRSRAGRGEAGAAAGGEGRDGPVRDLGDEIAADQGAARAEPVRAGQDGAGQDGAGLGEMLRPVGAVPGGQGEREAR